MGFHSSVFLLILSLLCCHLEVMCRSLMIIQDCCGKISKQKLPSFSPYCLHSTLEFRTFESRPSVLWRIPCFSSCKKCTNKERLEALSSGLWHHDFKKVFLVTVVSLVPPWLFITHVAQPRMSEKGALFGCSVREGPCGVDVVGESPHGGSAWSSQRQVGEGAGLELGVRNPHR